MKYQVCVSYPVYLTLSIYHSICVSSMCVLSHISHFMFPTPCINHSVYVYMPLMCIPSRISHFVYPTSCMTHSVCVSPMYILSRVSVFHSVCISFFEYSTLCVFHSVIPLYVYATPYIYYFPLLVSFNPQQSPIPLSPTSYKYPNSYSTPWCIQLYVPLHVDPTPYVLSLSVLLIYPIPSVFPSLLLPLPCTTPPSTYSLLWDFSFTVYFSLPICPTLSIFCTGW